MGYSQWSGLGGHEHEKIQKHPYFSSLKYDQIEIGREIKTDERIPLPNSLPNLFETMNAQIIGMISSVEKNNIILSLIVIDHIASPNVSPKTANKAR